MSNEIILCIGTSFPAIVIGFSMAFGTWSDKVITIKLFIGFILTIIFWALITLGVVMMGA